MGWPAPNGISRSRFGAALRVRAAEVSPVELVAIASCRDQELVRDRHAGVRRRLQRSVVRRRGWSVRRLRAAYGVGPRCRRQRAAGPNGADAFSEHDDVLQQLAAQGAGTIADLARRTLGVGRATAQVPRGKRLQISIRRGQRGGPTRREPAFRHWPRGCSRRLRRAHRRPHAPEGRVTAPLASTREAGAIAYRDG